MFNKNLILNTDSYKISHWKQYPKHTDFVSSYIESRGGRWNRTLFFGLQMFLKEYFTTPITMKDIDIAEEFVTKHGLPFYRQGWEYIVNKYNGKLPIMIQAPKEGSIIETGNVLVQIVNTDYNCYWLTSYLETILLRAVWYPVTIATNSYMCKQIIKHYLERSSDNPEAEINFKLHDFGFRGVSSWESGAIGGCAHLVNFMGTDTIAGLIAAREYYNDDMAGFSIPASEHSTITSWGKENESLAFNNMIEQFGGENHIYACVSDSYDIYDAVENKWPALKDKIIAKGGTLVVRPDSGNPVAVVCGVIERLMSKFGYEINSKGFKVLPSYIRVIQGDGIEEKSIRDILQELEFRHISASNIAFGMGGALLQHLDRDTLRFAMKCSAVCIDGEWKDVYKDPITDQNKKSKRGRLALVIDENGIYKTIREEELLGRDNQLDMVFKDGEILREQTFSDIRARSNQ